MKSTEIVELARDHLRQSIRDNASNSLPDPGWRWGGYSLQARRESNKHLTAIEVIQAAQRLQGCFESRHSKDQLADYARMLEHFWRKEFPDFLPHFASFCESEYAAPETILAFDGRLVSSPVYSHGLHIMRCLSYLRPSTVLEIGGGTGLPGRLWMINSIHRPNVYINVDLPESLYSAEVYLRYALPNFDIAYIQDGTELERVNFDDGRVILLCPVHRLSHLQHVNVDLIVNTGSMQEMTESYVSFYEEFIERSKTAFFYSHNYFGQKIDLLLESLNFAAPVMGSQWRAVHKGIYEDPTRPVAELLFQRQTPQGDANDQALALLARQTIAGILDYLEVFDALRAVDSTEILVRGIRKILDEVDFIPKEVVWLAKRALELDPQDGDAQQFLDEFSGTINLSLKEGGATAANAEKARGEYIRSDGHIPLLDGRLIETTDGTIVEIAGSVRRTRSGNCGDFEHTITPDGKIRVSGSILEGTPSDDPLAIYAFQDGGMVGDGKPHRARDADGTCRNNFAFEMDVGAGSNPRILVEFRDGSVGALDRKQVNSPSHTDAPVTGQWDGSRLIVGQTAYDLAPGNGGSVEGVNETPHGYVLNGWAADVVGNAPAASIVAVVGGDVIAAAWPTARRPDIEAGYGSSIHPAGFTMEIPKKALDTAGGGLIVLLTLTNAGTAVRLAVDRSHASLLEPNVAKPCHSPAKAGVLMRARRVFGRGGRT